MRLGAWKVALRIARRDALRAKGRSALIVAMVALPVLGVTGADVVHRSGQLTPAERVERVVGGADALVTALAPGRSVEQAPVAEDGAFAVEPRPGQAPTPEQQKAAGTDPVALVTGLLPPGSVLTAARPGPETGATSPEGLVRTLTAEADLTDPLWHGRLNLVDGHAPGGPLELAATRAFLDNAGLAVGGTTTLPGLERTTFTITGVVEHPDDLRRVELVAQPGALLDQIAAATPPDSPAGERSGPEHGAWLVRLPAGAALDWAKVQEFNAHGYTITARSVALAPPPRAAVPYYRDAYRSIGPAADNNTKIVVATVTGMGLLEVALLAGPAFAVGARRSRRQLALLGAAGGRRSHVGAVVLGGGLVLGVAGAVAGVALGTGAVAGLRPWIERAGGARFGHFALPPLDLLAIAGIGLLTALLAAALPALQAARRSVTAGLTGRDTVHGPNRWVTLLGLVLLAAGAILALYGAGAVQRGLPVVSTYDARTLTVLGGSITAELGLLACTPFLVALVGRAAGRLPLGPRLALRDSARHRSRTAPAVAAVMAAVAGAVAIGVYSTSTDAENRRDYRPEAPYGAVQLLATTDGHQLDVMRAELGKQLTDLGPRADLADAVYRFCASCSSTVQLKGTANWRTASGPPRLAAGDAAVLRTQFGVHDPAAEQALAAGKILVFDRAFLADDGRTVLRLRGGSGGPLQPGEIPKPELQEVPADAVLVENPTAARFAQGLILPSALPKLGLAAQPTGSIWVPATPPDRKAQQRAEAAVVRLNRAAQLEVERGYQPRGDALTLALSGFAALVVLGAAGIATGLAAADSRQDQATLAAVGAPPRIRRTMAGLQCALIALLGALLGAVNGFVPAVGLLKSRASGFGSQPALITAPWGQLLLVVLVLPVVAGLLAALFTRSRIPLGRRLS
ncbi:putative ABC transport system permease protein [Kitasatospora sp. MAA19]|uniref:FtsX-like permease family protein n=1 Tax=unclassified Kitasatospora TaxID=2633591 RepID=UPI0024744895|nr:FtsX-like permease family protein [Kitasatospora sp. MAA19]MDH6711289.1 putative ABC transport system permease protein [Kitasatospora sp. MAA19]